MRYCGVDLSTRAIDLAFLDTDSNEAQWVRVPLEGADAWERILSIRSAIAEVPGALWETCCLVAIEKPIPDQRGLLGNVLGAISASLPAELRQPHRCWTVVSTKWKKDLGLHGTQKPSRKDLEQILPGLEVDWMLISTQDQWDALCIAAWARKTNEGT